MSASSITAAAASASSSSSSFGAFSSLTDAAKVFKKIHPLEYHKSFLKEGVRTGDGRELDEYRSASVTTKHALSSCDASSLVKLGQTTSVICGIKSELAIEPKSGVVMVQVRVPALCSEKMATQSGGFSSREKRQQEISQLINDVIQRCIDTDSLIIEKDKVVWVLYVDLYVLEDDGSVEDACLLAAMSALNDLKLPKVYIDEEHEEVKLFVSEEGKYSYEKPDLLRRCAFSSTFALLQLDPAQAQAQERSHVLLTDPTQEEESLAETKCIFVYDEEGQLMSASRLSGPTAQISEKEQKRAMAQSKIHATQTLRKLLQRTQE